MPSELPNSDRLDSYFRYLRAHNSAALRMWQAQTEAAFCEAAEDALNQAIVRIEEGARVYLPLDERGLSLLLAQLLGEASIPAEAERFCNGHVDVTISDIARRPFRMLGECKIYRGVQHHCDGCKQLLNRYSSGRSRRTFCLDYFKSAGMYAKLAKFRRHFDTKKPFDQLVDVHNHTIKGAFVSTHRHSSAAEVDILHCGCNLYCG